MKEQALSDEEVARSTAPSTHEPPERDITDGGPDMVQFLAEHLPTGR